MKIAILGSGGREHAIAEKISKSSKLKKLYCIPGNAGTSHIAENINLEIKKVKIYLSIKSLTSSADQIPNFYIKKQKKKLKILN